MARWWRSERARRTAISLAVVAWTLVPLAASAVVRADAIELTRARQILGEAHALCTRDSGALWGVPFCSPVMLVDPKTREIVASHADRQGFLKASGSVFVGRLPDDQNIANTTTTWAGVAWTQLMWPLPDDETRRGILLVHEMFHGVQREIGIPLPSAANAHLDTIEGRCWLFLEWRALERALLATDTAVRRQAVLDALLFRTERRRLVPTAAAEECAMELGEGLAQYTGVVVMLPDPRARAEQAVADMHRQLENPSMVRSFPYGSGPAYGVLLDMVGAEWRPRAARGEDLGKMLAEAVHAVLPPEASRIAAERSAVYGATELRAAEEARAAAIALRVAGYRKRLVGGPTLRIPLRNMKVQFDARTLVPLGQSGMVYPTMRVVDDWGILTVTDGALLSDDWKAVTVAAPKPGETAGEGWSLQLNVGWRLLQEAGGRWTLIGPAARQARHVEQPAEPW